MTMSFSITFGEKEGSRRRRSWTERWEEDRKARLGILQKAAGQAEEPQRRSPSQVQEIRLKNLIVNNERSLYNLSS